VSVAHAACKVSKLHAGGEGFDKNIGQFKHEYLGKWWQTDTGFPNISHLFNKGEKAQRQRHLELLLENALSELKKCPPLGCESSEWGARVRVAIAKTGEYVLGMTGCNLEILSDWGFLKAAYTFFGQAREFDSSVKLDEIIQAVRNVWIMNCIQMLMGFEVRTTPSVFAYSMLYPCTDNFLDSSDVSIRDKMSINLRFRKRLAGEAVTAENRYESSLFKLVGMIEQEYPRTSYPAVYDSLLAIHGAQEKSLIQQKGWLSPYETDVIGISVEKGGTSVLTDAYLVQGNLTGEQAEFMFGFGVLLQLIDDLQDLEADRRNNHMSVFSQTAEKWKLDGITNRLINFILDLLNNDEYFPDEGQKGLKADIAKNCILLIQMAIAQNTHLYSKAYVKRMEEYTPFSFSYIRRLHKRIGWEISSLRKHSPRNSVEDLIAAAVVPE
jgi:hypothetical protein